MCRLVDDEAIIDDDETASDLEDAKVAAVPQEKCLARKAKRSSSQMSVMDRNENARCDVANFLCDSMRKLDKSIILLLIK